MRIAHLNRQRNTVGDSGRPIDIEFTGPLILAGNPTEGVDAATKQYVDNRFLSLSAGDLKSGILPIGRLPAFSGDLTNVAGSNVFTLNPTGVTSGTYRKVTVDAKGRVIGSSALGASDIPPLDWTKITKNKPTTLAGYGITDGINLTGDTIVGTLKSNATPTAAMHAVTRGYIETAASGAGGLVSPGVIIGFPTTTTPSGYLRCNGGEVNKTTYAALYTVVGDLFGGDLMPGNGKPWKQQYAFNDQQSTDITGWTTGPSLPAALRISQAIVTKNRVYLLGGYSGGQSGIVYTAPINIDGTLGTWSTGTSLPGNVVNAQVIVTKNRVYLLSGWTDSTYVSKVYTAPINEDGTLGTWSTGTSLPEGTAHSQAIVTKNRVYLLGGHNASGRISTVRTAPINEDGTLGTWTTGTSLPGVLATSQAIVTKNRVYLLGGIDVSSSVATVYTAPINEDGTLGAWTTGTNLPEPLSGSQAIVTKNRVYLLGGWNNSGSLPTVYTAPINADGTLGAWTTGTSLPVVLSDSQAIVTKNRVYMLGGTTQGNLVVSTVYTAPFSGGLNDYSAFYDGTYSPLTNSNNFRLPNYTSRESTAERYYIKY